MPPLNARWQKPRVFPEFAGDVCWTAHCIAKRELTLRRYDRRIWPNLSNTQLRSAMRRLMTERRAQRAPARSATLGEAASVPPAVSAVPAKHLVQPAVPNRVRQ